MPWTTTLQPTILVTAGVFGLLEAIALSAGIFGLWLGLLLNLALGRYCYSLLRATAQGHKEQPAITIESMNPVGEMAVLGHMVLFGGLLIATARWQPLGLIVAVMTACVFPASAALMAMTRDLAVAVNPAAIRSLAATLGGDYARLAAACGGIICGVLLIDSLLLPDILFLTSLIGLVLWVWGLLAVFALIGAAMRQHRDALDIPGEQVPQAERQQFDHQREWQQALNQAYVALRSGLKSAGYATLHKLAAENGDGVEIHTWLFENLLEWEEQQYALEVAAKLLLLLLDADDGSAALALYRRCVRIDRAFTVPRDTAERLAEHAANFGQHGLADQLRHGT